MNLEGKDRERRLSRPPARIRYTSSMAMRTVLVLVVLLLFSGSQGSLVQYALGDVTDPEPLAQTGVKRIRIGLESRTGKIARFEWIHRLETEHESRS